MKCFITIGKIDIKYIIMISLSIGSFLGIMYSFNLYVEDKKKYYDGYRENNKLLKSFMRFLGISYLIFGELIRKKIVYKKDEKPIENLIKIKDIIFIFLVCLLFLLSEFLAIYLKIKTGTTISLDERYNSIEFIFFFLVSLFIFKMRYYKHQYISILLIIALEITRYIVKLNNNNNNDNGNKPKSGNKMNTWVEFALQIVRAAVDAIFIGYSKLLMEIKFFSPYKATYIFGVISLISILIAYIILSFIKVDETNKNVCFIFYKNNCYIENLFSVFCDFTFKQFLGLFFYSVCSGIYQFFYIFIVKDYTMCHFFLFFQFCSVLTYIYQGKMNKGILTIIIITSILEIFITFVFLELIELHFCGLNRNIKYNIEKRAITEELENDENVSRNSSLVYVDEDYVTKKKELKKVMNE